MFAHLYGADLNWLKRWKGSSPSESPFFDLGSMAEVRRTWDPLEAEQKASSRGLSEADLSRGIDYKNSQGQAFRIALGCAAASTWPITRRTTAARSRPC
jgi:hypothetical protein